MIAFIHRILQNPINAIYEIFKNGNNPEFWNVCSMYKDEVRPGLRELITEALSNLRPTTEARTSGPTFKQVPLVVVFCDD